MFKKYQLQIEKTLTEKTNEDWTKILDKHKEIVSIIQHERLIHLLVTIFTGLIMSLSYFVTIISEKLYLLFLDVPLTLLFIGYLVHYRFLENTTQKFYLYTDIIRKNISHSKSQNPYK